MEQLQEEYKNYSDGEIEIISDELFEKLKKYFNPQDTASILTLISYKALINSFEEKEKAVESVNTEAKLLIKFLNEFYDEN